MNNLKRENEKPQENSESSSNAKPEANASQEIDDDAVKTVKKISSILLFLEKHQWLASGIVTVILALFTFVFLIGTKYKGFETAIENLGSVNESVSQIEDNMVKKKDFDSFKHDITSQFKEVRDKIDRLENKTSRLRTDTNNLETIFRLQTGKPLPVVQDSFQSLCDRKVIPLSTKKELWDNDAELLTDKAGMKHIARDLVDKPLLLHYTQEGPADDYYKQDVIFYGQFKDNKWDGDCLINVYINGKLYLITEVTYDLGEMLSYRQVFHYVTERKKEVWSISSDRICIDEQAFGYSKNFYKKDDIREDFDINDVNVQNLLTIDQFEQKIDMEQEGFYYGRVSNGEYNDNTGEAYLVKYADDGTVRTLYCGNFANGRFEDNTGQAWWISRQDDKPTNPYYFYQGRFSKGQPIDNKEMLQITDVKQIKDTIRARYFDCDLKWYGFEKL